jgi:Na+(H+)/acetate symporter ActP
MRICQYFGILCGTGAMSIAIAFAIFWITEELKEKKEQKKNERAD